MKTDNARNLANIKKIVSEVLEDNQKIVITYDDFDNMTITDSTSSITGGKGFQDEFDKAMKRAINKRR